MLSRRSFLANSAAVTAAAVLPRFASAADADPYGGFTVAIQSYTFRKFEFERALKAMKDLGIRHGEFFRNHIPTDTTGEKMKAVKKLLADYDITPVSFGVESFSKAKADEAKKRFAFAQELGVKYLSADPDPDSLDMLDKLVAETKIGIAIHPHGPVGKMMHRWKSAEFIMKAVKDHHELIGTCLDTGHLIRSAQLDVTLDPAEEVKTMGARNFGLHLKDHDNVKKTDVVFGDKAGKLDVAAVLKSLKGVKFKGYIAIEYEANENDPTADVKVCLTYLKDQIKKLG